MSISIRFTRENDGSIVVAMGTAGRQAVCRSVGGCALACRQIAVALAQDLVRNCPLAGKVPRLACFGHNATLLLW